VAAGAAPETDEFAEEIAKAKREAAAEIAALEAEMAAGDGKPAGAHAAAPAAKHASALNALFGAAPAPGTGEEAAAEAPASAPAAAAAAASTNEGGGGKSAVQGHDAIPEAPRLADEWVCGSCTYHNVKDHLACDMCGAVQPHDEGEMQALLSDAAGAASAAATGAAAGMIDLMSSATTAG